MAVDINIVTLVGRLTRDAELKYTSTGLAISKFSLAVNRLKRAEGKAGDDVSFFDMVLMGKIAESLNVYLKKGKQVIVSGELRQSRWESEGKKLSRIEVMVNNLQLLGTTGGSDFSAPNSDVSGYSAQSSTSNSISDFEDDIPF